MTGFRLVRLALLAVFFVPSAAQADGASCSGWRWANPRPVPGDFKGVLATDDGFLAWGSVLASSSGASAWEINLSGVDVADAVRTADGYVAVGKAGAVWLSQDGRAWTAASRQTTKDLVRVITNGATTVAFSSDGEGVVRDAGGAFVKAPICTGCSLSDGAWAPEPIGMFVLVGGTSTASFVATSADGVNWEIPALPPMGGLLATACGGGRLVAAGRSGLVASSVDGRNWTVADTGEAASYYLGSVAFAEGCAGSVIVGEGDQILTSDDDRSWSAPEPVGRDNTISSLAVDESGVLAAGTYHWSGPVPTLSSCVLLESSDGLSWSDAGVNFQGGLLGVAATPEEVVAAGYEYMFDPNLVETPMIVSGRSATEVVEADLSGLGLGAGSLSAVASGPGGFVAAGTHGLILTSFDGAAWTKATNPSPGDLLAVAASPIEWIAAGPSGLVTSSDRQQWSPVWSLGGAFRDVVFSGGVFLVLGGGGTIISRSTDGGASWSAAAGPLPGEFVRLAVGPAGPSGPTFAAVGPHGEFARSLDGKGGSWAVDTDPTGGGLSVLAWFGGRWVAAGSGGRVAWRECGDADDPAGLTSSSRPYRWLVPASVHAEGALGTSWRTDLSITSSSDAAADVRLTFLPAEGAPAPSKIFDFVLEAGASIQFGDVVAELFDLPSGLGSVVVSSSAPVAIGSRTFDDAPGGTYGQEIPAVPFENVVAAGETDVLAHLSGGGPSPRLRTNVGVANVGDAEIEATIELEGNVGTPLATLSVIIPAGGCWQADPFLQAATGEHCEAQAKVRTSTSGARFFAWASVIDNRSGDPIFRWGE